MWWIIGGLVWFLAVFFAWACCAAAGKADEDMGLK